jgi:acetylornithine deacetylase/succinyl-diaminopimelate desuccinylase-like protein
VTEAEALAVYDRVAATAGEAAALTQALVRLPTENPPGETDAAMESIAGWLEARGLAVERVPVPDPFARQCGRAGVMNLIVRRRFGPGPTVALAVAIDTLPAGDGWRRDPFSGEIHGGAIHGRGARDSKADLAAYVFALEAVAAAPLSGTVELHITADEETGGFLGPAFLLGQGLTSPDVAIASGTSYQVIVGQEGVLHLEVLLRGRQAHASRPADGADAIAAAIPVLSALHAAAREAPHPMTISTIEGGRGVNLVADRVRFTVDRRIGAEEDGEAVERDLVARAVAAHRGGEVEIECGRLLLAEPVAPTPASERLAALLSRHAEAAMGRPVPIVSAPVTSGARHYALAGIPTALYGVGPPVTGEGADFTGEESVALDDLVRTTAAVATTLGELLARR